MFTGKKSFMFVNFFQLINLFTFVHISGQTTKEKKKIGKNFRRRKKIGKNFRRNDRNFQFFYFGDRRRHLWRKNDFKQKIANRIFQ